MRADEIMPSTAAQTMMMKMRKGSAVGLNAKLLTEILGCLQGWAITNTKLLKPSNGGWVLSGTPWGEFLKKNFLGNYGGKTYKSNRIEYHIDYNPNKTGGDDHWEQRRAQEYAALKDTVAPLIQANMTKKGRWEVKNLNIAESTRGDYKRVTVSFDFFTVCSAYIVTAPDGATYEICGDFKNGAIEETTFVTFFAWAVENTDFMDQILSVLNLEPIEAKADPRKPYTPPPGSSAATIKVFELLKKMTQSVREEQKASLINILGDRVERAMAAMHASDTELVSKIIATDPGLFQAIKTANRQINPKWKEIVENLAEKQVEEMQNVFVFKNTRKLSSIFTAKGENFEEKVLSVDGRRGVITAALKFNFADGSSFRVDQSIVSSYTHDRWGRYTYFYRFPTTFHDVVLANGEKMGYPSEERMNTVFVEA